MLIQPTYVFSTERRGKKHKVNLKIASNKNYELKASVVLDGVNGFTCCKTQSEQKTGHAVDT